MHSAAIVETHQRDGFIALVFVDQIKLAMCRFCGQVAGDTSGCKIQQRLLLSLVPFELHELLALIAVQLRRVQQGLKLLIVS